MADTIRGAVIGYGAAFNMGKHHAGNMTNTEGTECVAICDIDKARTRAAKKDFPGVKKMYPILGGGTAVGISVLVLAAKIRKKIHGMK